MDNPEQLEHADRRYIVQQNKRNEADKPPVFAKVMRGKDGKFEGVSFIKNKDKASIMTVADAQAAIDWSTSKKPNAGEYETKIICVGQ
jgi:hypothetical protein